MTPVGAERTLRATGRAGRVEDGDRVVGIEPRDGVVGERVAAHEIIERRVGVGAVGTHPDELHTLGASVLDDPREPVVVEQRDLGAGVVERVGELRAGPPRVERDDDGTEHRAGPEADDELGQVAHGDGDAVAALHAERGAQLLGEREGAGAHVGEGQAFVVVDEVHEVGVGGAHVERVDDGAWRAHEHAQGHAVALGLLDLEETAGADERLESGIVAVDGCDHARTLPRDVDLSPRSCAQCRRGLRRYGPSARCRPRRRGTCRDG